MSRYVNKVTYELNLSGTIDELNRSDRNKTLNEVGQYLVEQILESCGRSKTTVQGGKWKQGLSKKYAEYKKNQSSSVSANMELTGDMLDSLKFEVKGNKVEVGIFDYDQAQKADNHNKFSSASKSTKVPQRQFIPKKGEQFRSDIRREINQIIQEAIDGQDKS